MAAVLVLAIVPLGLIVLEHLSFRMISNDFGINEAAQIELLRSELGHDGD